jgi:hypothetical protein
LEALGRSREGVCDPGSVRPYEEVVLPEVGAADSIRRWDPWVRNFVLQFELLQFEFGKPQGRQVSLSHGGNPVVTLVRPELSVFKKQLADVLSYASLRPDRTAEALWQIDGQWAFWGALLPARLPAIPYVQEIVTAVTQMAVFVEMRFKHEFACPRPANYSVQVQPMLTTPGHGTYPMGHATQIFTVGRVLKELIRESFGNLPADLATQMDRLSLRMSENRIVAGVHFPVDLWAGVGLGLRLGEYAVGRFTGRSPVTKLESEVDPGSAYKEEEARKELKGINEALRTPGRDGRSVPAPLEATWVEAVTEMRRAMWMSPPATGTNP